MLRNAPLSMKLLLILIFPLLGFLAFAGLFVADKSENLGDMRRAVTATSAAQKVSDVVTTLQRERGASGVFLGSGGKSMQDKLKTFRQETDKAISEMRAQSTDGIPGPDKVNRAFEELIALRLKVDSLGVNNTESGTRFTDIIKTLIGFSYSMESSIEDPEILRGLSSLNQFVDMKERAGRERVLLGLAFNQNRFDAALLSRFSRNLGEFSGISKRSSAGHLKPSKPNSMPFCSNQDRSKWPACNAWASILRWVTRSTSSRKTGSTFPPRVST